MRYLLDELKRKDDKITELEDKTSHLAEVIVKRNTQITELEKKVLTRDDLLNFAEIQYNRRGSNIEELEAKLKDAAEEAGGLERELERKAERILELEGKVVNLLHEINRLNFYNDELTRNCDPEARNRDIVLVLEDRIDDLENRVATLEDNQ